MVCTPSFPEEFPMDCVLDLVQSVRKGDFSVPVIKKALWVGGAVIDTFDGDTVTMQNATNVQVVAEELDQALKMVTVESTSIPPQIKEMIKALIKLLLEQW